MQVRFGDVEVSYSQRGNPTFRVELWHDGLKKHRLIKGSELDVVKRKAQLQVDEWTKKWKDVEAREALRATREGRKALAAKRTAEAQGNLQDLQRTLVHTLSVDDAIDWEELKDKNQFAETRPAKPRAPERSPEPKPNDPLFKVRVNILDKLFSSRREAKEARAAELYEDAHRNWTTEAAEQKKRFEKELQLHEEQVAAWERRKEAFVNAQDDSNAAVERQRERYERCEGEAIEEYYDLVLSRSKYPDWMPQEFQINYTQDTANLLVCYSLPSVDTLPRLQEVVYVQSRDDFREKKSNGRSDQEAL